MAVTEQQVRAVFAPLAGGAPAEFFRHVADDVSWAVLGTHPLAGHYPSKRAFQEATFDRLGKLFAGPLTLATCGVLVDGDRAVVELAARATAKSGVRFDNDYCWVCRFEAGVIVEVRAYLDSALVAEVIARGGAPA